MDRLIVRGVEVELIPYTEKRFKRFREIQQAIDEYIEKNPGQTFDDIPVSLKGKWWKAKGDILWKPVREGLELDEHFYAHEDFESGLLQKAQNFFLIQRMFL
jgi:hypothetical protein